MDKIKKIIENTGKYLQGVKAELKRVAWPSKQELKASTTIVLITMIAVTAYLWFCNEVFSKLFQFLR